MLRLTRRVTCPYSAHLETVQYILDSNGYVADIEACSTFEPCAEVDCDQLCKRHMNKRRRLERSVTLPGRLPVTRS